MSIIHPPANWHIAENRRCPCMLLPLNCLSILGNSLHLFMVHLGNFCWSRIHQEKQVHPTASPTLQSTVVQRLSVTLTELTWNGQVGCLLRGIREQEVIHLIDVSDVLVSFLAKQHVTYIYICVSHYCFILFRFFLSN